MKNLSLYATLAAFVFLCACSSSRKSATEQGSKRKTTLTSVKPNVKNPNRAVLNASGDGLTPGITQNNGAGSEENAANIANNAITKASVAARTAQQKMGTISDEDFLNKAAVSEMMDILIARNIQKTTGNKKIMDYAAMIIKDHQQIQNELKQIITDKHVVLADSVNANLQSIQTAADKINSSVTAGKGDLEYVQLAIADHQKAIRIFEAGSRSKDPVISQFAAKYLPMLKKHLEDAQELTKEVAPRQKN
ncbi:MAG TPA: DUF4142 domain-containing protein [Pedobacter sp.]|nr:DUF4142 domain-containing protein [Pedobacter sp.]